MTPVPAGVFSLRRRFLHPLLLVIALACAPASASLPDTRPRATDDALRSALQAIRVRHGVPGLAAAVFDRETVRAFGVGELQPGGNPVTPDSRFRAGQVSLLFTGITSAVLTTDGSMPADGELRRLAPEVDFHNPWSGERPVRVADLLAHRAGLGAVHFRDVHAESPGQPLLAGINSAFRALRLEYRPGEREQYSVVGHAIAAYLVEKASGFSYDEVLERMLFRPLEMNATLGRPAGALPGDAIGHTGRPAHGVRDVPLNFPAAGEVWISANDLARIGQLLLNDGRFAEHVVLPAGATVWLESAPPGSTTLVPGARQGVHAEEFGGFLFYTQTGALRGFLARFAYSPALGRGYVLLLNHGGARAALAEAEQLLRGQLLDGGAHPGPVPAPAATGRPESLRGWYRRTDSEPPPRAFHLAWFGIAHVEDCGDGWCLSGPGRHVRLEPFDGRRLRETGHWHPGWDVRATASDLWLENATESWRRVPGWQVFLSTLAAAIVLAGVVLAPGLLVGWGVALWRRRLSGYRDLVPRLVPLAAMLALVAYQVVLFSIGYPALGEFGAPAVTLLVLSILAPVLAVLALPAAIAGFAWKQPWRAAVAAAFLALAALVMAGGMAASGLVAFQSWNY